MKDGLQHERTYVAYTVGVLCRSTTPVNCTAVLDELVAHAGIAGDGRRTEGEDWCACDVQFGESACSSALEVSRDAQQLTTLSDSAVGEGFEVDASGGGGLFAIELTLSGEVDWPPVLDFLQGVIEQHHGLLYDDVAGFKASLA